MGMDEENTFNKPPRKTTHYKGLHHTQVAQHSMMRSFLVYKGYLMKHKRITSKKTIQEVRKPYCEICGQRTNIEPHHINTRGSGGGDIKENLIQLCTQCHINTHSGQYPTKDDCLNKVAEREGITYDEAYAINRIAMGYDV